jgi:hypothetical protein
VPEAALASIAAMTFPPLDCTVAQKNRRYALTFSIGPVTPIRLLNRDDASDDANMVGRYWVRSA